MRVAYIRVSTAEQNEARQVEALKRFDIEKWFQEKASGKDRSHRPELQRMLEFVREGDTVYVHDFSRLARSTKNLLERQREGIAIQKQLDQSRPPEQRKYRGRRPIQIDNFAGCYERYRTRQVSKSVLAKELGISRPTLNKLILDFEQAEKQN